MKTILLLTATALLAAPMAADAGRRAAVKPAAVKKTTAADAALQAALAITSSFASCTLTSTALVSVGTASETASDLSLSPASSTQLLAQVVAETFAPAAPLPSTTTPIPGGGTTTNPTTTAPETKITSEEKPALSAP